MGIFLVLQTGTTFAAEPPTPRRAAERFSVETRVFPFSKLKDPPRGTPHENLEIQPENVRFRVGLPPLLFPQKRAMLSPSLSYEQVHFNYRGWDNSYDDYRVDTLHAIGASIFYRQPLQSPVWSFGSFLSAGLASDFKSVTMQALRLQGGAFFNRKVPGGNLNLGFAVIDSFGRPRLFPAIGFEPAADAVHKFTLRIPVEASYFYCPPERRWEAGVAARVAGLNARLEEPGTYHGKSVAYSAGTVGPSIRVKLTKAWMLHVDSGWAPYHRFQILDRKDKLRDYDLATSYFVATGLRLSL